MKSFNWSLIATGTLLLLCVVSCGGSTPLNKGDGSAGSGGTTSTGAAGAGGGGGAATGNGGAGGADAGLLTCAPGADCTDGDTCTTTMGCGGGGRERACFCDQNGVLACENCQLSDGGTGGTGGTDAGANACPSGVTSGMA